MRAGVAGFRWVILYFRDLVAAYGSRLMLRERQDVGAFSLSTAEFGPLDVMSTGPGGCSMARRSNGKPQDEDGLR